MKLTFGERLAAAGSLGEKLLAFGDSLATEADTFLGIEDGTLPDEALDTAGTAIDLVEGDLVDDLGAVLAIWLRQVSEKAVLIRWWNRHQLRRSIGSLQRWGATHARRALISSIFSGRIWAKRSLRV